MKSLKLCFESLLDSDDDFYDTEHNKKVVEDWIKDNYITYGKLTITDDFIVNCTGDVSVENINIDSLTNGLFRWGDIRGNFNCEECENLTSLEGAPKKVGGSFYCSDCVKLKTLEGSPVYVGGNFYCSCCEKLISLEGAPKKVGAGLYCNGCINLKSLKGAPKKVGYVFDCSQCGNLTTIKDGPEKVGSLFYCIRCPKLTITDSDRKKYKIVQ